MHRLSLLMLLAAAPAYAASPFDTSALATGTTDTGAADTGDTGEGLTLGGDDTGNSSYTTTDTGWHGGYSAADLAGEPGGNAWDGACVEGSKAALVFVALLGFARRRA